METSSRKEKNRNTFFREKKKINFYFLNKILWWHNTRHIFACMPLSVTSTNEVRISVQVFFFFCVCLLLNIFSKVKTSWEIKWAQQIRQEKTGEMNNSFHWERWVPATDYYIIIRVDTTGVNGVLDDQHDRLFLLSFFRCIFYFIWYLFIRETHTPTNVCVCLCLCCVISNT